MATRPEIRVSAIVQKWKELAMSACFYHTRQKDAAILCIIFMRQIAIDLPAVASSIKQIHVQNL